MYLEQTGPSSQSIRAHALRTWVANVGWRALAQAEDEEHVGTILHVWIASASFRTTSCQRPMSSHGYMSRRAPIASEWMHGSLGSSAACDASAASHVTCPREWRSRMVEESGRRRSLRHLKQILAESRCRAVKPEWCRRRAIGDTLCESRRSTRQALCTCVKAFVRKAPEVQSSPIIHCLSGLNRVHPMSARMSAACRDCLRMPLPIPSQSSQQREAPRAHTRDTKF